MKKRTKNIASGVLTGLMILSCNQPSQAGAVNVPDYVASLRPGMVFTLNKQSPVYKVIDQYSNTKEKKSVVEIMAVFDEPVSYADGVADMAFPRLDTSPFGCEQDAANKDMTFTTFYVQMEIDEAASTWQPASIVAYKPGDNPSVAVFSAYRGDGE